MVVSSLVALTAVILIGLTTLSYFITRTLASPAPALEVQITGHQWWWEVRYQNDDPSQVLTTANEIHVPVGKAVKFTLEAADVIHSFWVPNLAGKQDLIPGQVNTISFTPKRAGIYRGQCAEFCGLQHANMALLIIAQDQADFESWRADQLHPAVSQSGGEQLFFARGCALCHTIRGTGAGGRLGPDLTHIGSRLTLASGMLRNSRAELSAWLNDPQGLKPGNKMPNIPLQPRETDELVDYLKGLR